MKQIITTKMAPAAIGPYSQGIKANGFLFLSGQIALDPTSGEVVGDEVRAQTEQVLKNLEVVLTAAGSSLAAVVKTTAAAPSEMGQALAGVTDPPFLNTVG